MNVNTILACSLGLVAALGVGGVVIISAMGHEVPVVLGTVISSALTGLAAMWRASDPPGGDPGSGRG